MLSLYIPQYYYMKKKFEKHIKALKVPHGQKISLKDFETDITNKGISKEEGEALLKTGIEQLSILQDKLYANHKNSVLIVIQAMDAAGKDSAVKHVMTGLNPQGVDVTSFKSPTRIELEHDYLWRHQLALPAKGQIGIFNRSHYENVLVTRVHPEFILNENLPGVNGIDDINDTFFDHRFHRINEWEKHLSENGTLVLKFFLYVSKEEQKKRLLERIDDPAKNWKFEIGDLKERALWKKYMHAYEEMLSHTSTRHAPWFVLPADDKWFTRICLSTIITSELEKLKPMYPIVNEAVKKDLQVAKKQLEAE
jgi:PPK2 family polyphosphate:nucleotide phosphotransferase